MTPALLPQIEHALPRTRAGLGQCLYIAHAVATVLHGAGLRPVIQAGSMQWPIIPEDEDDGERETHFAYMWTPDEPRSRAALECGLLPEMHCWVALPESDELIDFSTRHFPAHAAACGLDWRTPPPPDYLWCEADALPRRTVYRPAIGACILAARILWAQFRPRYLQTMPHR